MDHRNITNVEKQIVKRNYREIVGLKNVLAAYRVLLQDDVTIKWNLSFLSIGGHTNFKSTDVIDSAENKFINFGPSTIVSVTSKLSVLPSDLKGTGKDFGIILKIKPKNNRKRTWICCGGLGEWGTSGAAWWLANNWKEIRKKAKKGQFACVTVTTPGSDEDTQLIDLYLSTKDVENVAQEINAKAQQITDESSHNG